MDRKYQPSTRMVRELELIHPVGINLSNGIPAVVIQAGSEPVCRIDFVFNAGSRYQDKIFQASLANQMIPEGIPGKTGGQIAEEFEFYGSFFNVSADRDEADLTIHTLEKHLEPVLALTREVLIHADFPSEELDIIKANRIQSMKVDEQRVESQARKHFNRAAFGESHPYGIVGETEHIAAMDKTDLISFHSKAYTPENCRILITGPHPDKYIPLVDKLFGNNWTSENNHGKLNTSIPPAQPVSSIRQVFNVPGSVQTAIRIGKPLFSRTHDDFQGLTIVNTILGGYFGSRLMSNIREDKGYTYGISSHLAALQDDGFFMIGATVGAEVWQDAIRECFSEITKMSEELVDESELSRVKNYLIGQLQRSVDGPFQLADQFRPLWMNQLDFSYLNRFMTTILEITPEEIRSLAQRHLAPDSMLIVAAGPIET
jgi:predicted Zn-dependent peptidase